MSKKILLMSMFTFIASLILTCTVNGQSITKPEDFLGFKPGADFHLANYEQAIGYFEKIAAQSKRMQIFDMGETSEGRRQKYAIISSEENMPVLLSCGHNTCKSCLREVFRLAPPEPDYVEVVCALDLAPTDTTGLTI